MKRNKTWFIGKRSATPCCVLRAESAMFIAIILLHISALVVQASRTLDISFEYVDGEQYYKFNDRMATIEDMNTIFDTLSKWNPNYEVRIILEKSVVIADIEQVLRLLEVRGMTNIYLSIFSDIKPYSQYRMFKYDRLVESKPYEDFRRDYFRQNKQQGFTH